MYLEDIINYRNELDMYLSKLDFKTEVDEAGKTIVVETKETYIYNDEEDADKKINDARQDVGFAAATKKFKQGKVNKNGEIVKPDSWTVVIKLNH